MNADLAQQALRLVRAALEADVGRPVSWAEVGRHLGESRQNTAGYLAATRQVSMDKVLSWLVLHNEVVPGRAVELRMTGTTISLQAAGRDDELEDTLESLLPLPERAARAR